jgi:guanosine-3',5'-bis(diphosphate) 3'-pyrophosphohydrolase
MKERFFEHSPIMNESVLEDVLEKIRTYADNAHGDQTRRYSDDRYIVHPVRVMEMTRQYEPDVTIQAAALLHDVLEDTPVTKEALGEFLDSVLEKSVAERTLKLVEELTDVYIKNNFPGMSRRSRKQKEADRLGEASADAQTIKYADIIDNTDITYNDRSFAPVYLKECKFLLEKMKKGNPELRARARYRIEECLAQLKIEQRSLSDFR